MFVRKSVYVCKEKRLYLERDSHSTIKGKNVPEFEEFREFTRQLARTIFSLFTLSTQAVQRDEI